MEFPILSTIGLRRRRLDKTQKELAQLVGTSQSQIAKIESGEITPSYSTAMEIFERLEMLEHKEEKTAKEVMHKWVITIDLYDTVGKAKKIAKEHGITQFPVMKGKEIYGSISTYDLLEAKNNDKIGLYVKEALPSLPSIAPSSQIRSILKYARAVVIVEKGKIIGIVTPEDLLS